MQDRNQEAISASAGIAAGIAELTFPVDTSILFTLYLRFAMEIIELTKLELKVERLLNALEELKAENKHLRNQVARHAREKSVQYQNNQQVVGKIRKIINTLQEALV